MTRAGKRLAVLLAASLSALLAAEVVLRAFFPLPLWRLPETFLLEDGERRRVALRELRRPGERFRPGIVYETCYDTRFGAGRPYMDERGCVRTSINAEGWRGPSVPHARSERSFRFLAVGDSLTFGQGVPFEATWPEVLERLLADELARSGSALVPEAVNLGVSAFNLPEIRATVESEVPRYRPDLVIYGFFPNDGWLPGIDLRGVAGPARAMRAVLSGEQRGLARFSELWRRLQLFRARLAQRDAGPLTAAYAPDSANWRACEGHLRALHAAVRDAGAELLVVLLPEPVDRDGSYPFESVHAHLAAWLVGEGIACLDLMDVHRGLDPASLRVHPTDHHPNEIAQELGARAMLPWVADWLRRR